MAQQSCYFQKNVEVSKSVSLAYLLSLPKDYDPEGNKKYPLVLFLHGMGERGSNLDLVKLHGFPKIAEKEDFPFILVSPQCPLDIPRYSNWLFYIDSVIALLDDVIDRYQADEQKVYITGLSMGGYGTWEIAKQYSHKFAAAAPICGGGSTEQIERLVDMPVWAFHGAKDDVVPFSESEEMVEALRNAGGNVKLTIYPEANHDSWTETYNNPEFISWLLNQKRK